MDRNQIGQVIDNIVINAQQAMPEGGRIEITAENRRLAGESHGVLPAGNYVRIAVKDYGIGMPKDILPKIFDPFFSTKAKGHGLGLSTCYSIVNRHGGCIDVESDSGKGSTFTVYLPAVPDGAARNSTEPVSFHNGSGVFLVMDDEVVMRDIIGRMLVSFGYSVQYFSRGEEALDFIRIETAGKRKIAGCILDLTIPGGMGGKEAIEKLREIDKDLPAFVVSGYADDPIMAMSMDFGFNGSICKPFRRNELAELLNKHIGKVS
jgi:CheY-like chemotaxis protein